MNFCSSFHLLTILISMKQSCFLNMIYDISFSLFLSFYYFFSLRANNVFIAKHIAYAASQFAYYALKVCTLFVRKKYILLSV